MQEERSLKEVDKETEKSRILIMLRLAWYAGFETKIAKRHAIIYTTNPAHTELLFSEASVQRGKGNVKRCLKGVSDRVFFFF